VNKTILRYFEVGKTVKVCTRLGLANLFMTKRMRRKGELSGGGKSISCSGKMGVEKRASILKQVLLSEWRLC
jgi:hypothetical protein